MTIRDLSEEIEYKWSTKDHSFKKQTRQENSHYLLILCGGEKKRRLEGLPAPPFE